MTNEPIEESIKRVMDDFRWRRLAYKARHPKAIFNDDALPSDLTRHAEAAAIAGLFPPAPQASPPKPPPTDERGTSFYGWPYYG